MGRNGFLLHYQTTTAQQDPERLIGNLILYILYGRSFSIKNTYPPSRIIAMDETSISNSMVFNTTIPKKGAKSVCLKTTGHGKFMVSICLAARLDGTKLKPFGVFCATNRKSKS